MTINNMASNSLNTSMIRIATGQRINSARDDAAGLGIAEQMSAQITGFDRGTQNVMDMQNLVNTAEGGLNNISESLHRVRELTVQAQNGVLTDSDRQNIQFEIDQLLQEIDATTQRTEFNTQRLLDGSFNGHTAAGPDGRGPTVNIGNMSASMLLGPEPVDVIADASRPPTQPIEIQPPEDAEPNTPPTLVFPTQAPNESPLLQRLDDALTTVARERSYLGAMSNRFDTTIASNQIANLNLASARSGIRDADIALEVMNMNQQSIIEQAQLMSQQRQQEQQQQPLLSLLA